MEHTALLEMKRSAKSFDRQAIERYRSGLQTAQDTISVQKEMMKGLLGIERRAQQKLKANIQSIQENTRRIEPFTALAEKYSRLSLQPLKLRDQSGWPKLVVFSLEASRFSLGCVCTTDGWSGSASFRRRVMPAKLPSKIVECYDDVLRKLAQMSRSAGRSVSITCEFDGIIPADVKVKILESKKDFQQIFIIAESTGFVVEQKAPTIIQRDPIVAGFDGNDLWLIADFDTTPVEEGMIFTVPE